MGYPTDRIDFMDEQYLADQITTHGIEQVCNNLHDQGEGKLANEVMIAYTRKVQKEQGERVKKLKVYFDDLLGWCCDCCEWSSECDKYNLAIMHRKDGLTPMAVGTLVSCKWVRERAT